VEGNSLVKNKNNLHIFKPFATKPNLIYKSTEVEETKETDEILDGIFKDGWSISERDPELIVKGFSQLSIKEGYKLRAYQYIAGGNGNGIVWAIPSNMELPRPEECNVLTKHFLSPPKPNFALENNMEAIDGDKSPLSYVQSAIVYHELCEFGALWHGVNWGMDRILPYSDEENDLKTVEEYIEWDMLEDEPDIWEPHFYYNENDEPTVVFYTTNEVGGQTINRYTHTFSENSYILSVKHDIIARGGPGIIF